MFDDKITVESPGILPGIVRLNNLRTVHFSRNPNIARFLHEYDYVQEFGEGIDRMFNEMAAAGFLLLSTEIMPLCSMPQFGMG